MGAIGFKAPKVCLLLMLLLAVAVLLFIGLSNTDDCWLLAFELNAAVDDDDDGDGDGDDPKGSNALSKGLELLLPLLLLLLPLLLMLLLLPKASNAADDVAVADGDANDPLFILFELLVGDALGGVGVGALGSRYHFFSYLLLTKSLNFWGSLYGMTNPCGTFPMKAALSLVLPTRARPSASSWVNMLADRPLILSCISRCMPEHLVQTKQKCVKST